MNIQETQRKVLIELKDLENMGELRIVPEVLIFFIRFVVRSAIRMQPIFDKIRKENKLGFREKEK